MFGKKTELKLDELSNRIYETRMDFRNELRERASAAEVARLTDIVQQLLLQLGFEDIDVPAHRELRKRGK